uniref:Uncharacterized protein n=1 Tax=Setaria italica TaxID=4555 RepID=K3YKR5_SETIT
MQRRQRSRSHCGCALAVVELRTYWQLQIGVWIDKFWYLVVQVGLWSCRCTICT